MHTEQPRHTEDKCQLVEEICHTAEEIRQTSERLCEMAATTQQMSRVAVQMSQVARQKRKETLNGERKTYKNPPPPFDIIRSIVTMSYILMSLLRKELCWGSF